ncbi:related to component of the anaphase promoting complex [Ustilago bromivora]|uniref:Related to component of the anaphase promoting complex n=1 Tax=Ustilago bromivora TaxID=307758 RepID=A0A1K0FYP0_9BASI|nr:related to component of the anaphase promoting complex [Ustilago bromivora]SYW74828.1 related to component of the anaphase promoting complex [Ustilago bromivora]
MSLVQAWRQVLQSLASGSDHPSTRGTSASQLPSVDGYTTLTQFLEPSRPATCRFYDTASGRCLLDASANEALQTLLGGNASVSSSSKQDLSGLSPILLTLSNHYTDRCIQNFDTVAVELRASRLHGDLISSLHNIATWFQAWLSPYMTGSIFQGLNKERDDLLQTLRMRLRFYFDSRAAESLRQHLEQLFVEDTGNDLRASFVAHLNRAGLAGPALTLLTRVMHAEISRKVRAVVGAVELRPQDNVLPLESAARPVLQQWLDDEMKPRFAAIRDLCLQQDSKSTAGAMEEDDSAGEASSWQHRFDYELDKALCLTRANQLFDLVAMYPESSAALDDLRLSLQTADQRLSVAKTLSSSLQMRLLHPGAHTRDIIQMYVHLVRALREMDPTGVVLSRVVSPLRRYLRGRKDTVLVIVASMLGDDPDFTLLKDELERADQEEQEQEELDTHRRRRRPRRSLQTSTPAPSSGKSSKRAAKRRVPHNRRGASAADGSDSEASSEEDWDDPNWVPKPVEAGSGYRMSTSKDIISMLTSIFNDRSGFIAALEKSMADQLVQVKGYKAMKEYRNNMILKKRFGEKNMGKCDVMLGDVTESRRIDSEVHQRRRTKPIPASGVEGMVSRLHPLIVSRQFWPEHTTKPGSNPAGAAGNGVVASAASAGGANGSVGEFTLPPLFRRAQEEYGKTFSQSKAMRKLHWLNHLGTVELDVELDSGESLSLECTLIQASTLEVISRRSNGPSSATGAHVVTLTDVMEEFNLQREKDGRDALEFWVLVGLLKPVAGLADAFLVQSSLPSYGRAADEEGEGDDGESL